MKINASLIMVIAAAGSLAYGADPMPAVRSTVTVCTDFDPAVVGALTHARGVASGIFAGIGIRLQWRETSRCPQGSLKVAFSIHTPAKLNPGALAYALPYEGTKIVVLWDRIRTGVPGNDVAPLLGHVLAHEITHVLQGYSRHSDSGLMKAKWGPSDNRQMAIKPLPFTAEDVEIIYQGLARREERRALVASR